MNMIIRILFIKLIFMLTNLNSYIIHIQINLNERLNNVPSNNKTTISFYLDLIKKIGKTERKK